MMNDMRQMIEERVFTYRHFFLPAVIELLLDTTDGVVSAISLGAIHTLANVPGLKEEKIKTLIGMLDDGLLLNFYVYCERLRAVNELEQFNALERMKELEDK